MATDRFRRARDVRGVPIPPPRQDWLYVGYFGRGIRDRCNLGCILGALDQMFGREAFCLVTMVDKDVEVGTHVLIRPNDPRVAAVTAPMRDLVEQGENISDELFSDEVDRAIDKAWAEMSMADRIEWLAEGDDLPELALEPNVPPEAHVHTLLYRELDL